MRLILPLSLILTCWFVTIFTGCTVVKTIDIALGDNISDVKVGVSREEAEEILGTFSFFRPHWSTTRYRCNLYTYEAGTAETAFQAFYMSSYHIFANLAFLEYEVHAWANPGKVFYPTPELRYLFIIYDKNDLILNITDMEELPDLDSLKCSVTNKYLQLNPPIKKRARPHGAISQNPR